MYPAKSAVLISGCAAMLFCFMLPDKYEPPRKTRIFASPFGTYGFTCGLESAAGGEKTTATGTLFAFDDAGTQKTAWTSRLVCVPARVLVSDEGDVVTVNDYYRRGYEHSLVFYGVNGKIIADLRAEQFLTEDELKNKVTATESSRHWESECGIELDKRKLIVKLKWGRQIVFDLASGAILPLEKP